MLMNSAIIGGREAESSEGALPVNSPSVRCTPLPFNLALAVNVLLPGSGLIVIRRPWRGLAAALFFTACGHVLIFTTLIAPQRFDPRVRGFALLGAAATWLAAQASLWRARGERQTQGRLQQLQICYDLADDAWRDRRPEDACSALCVALTVDDENPHTYARLARLLVRCGRYDEARGAWKKVAALDRAGEYREQRAAALEELSGRSGAQAARPGLAGPRAQS
jgi:hypothetical protein